MPDGKLESKLKNLIHYSKKGASMSTLDLMGMSCMASGGLHATTGVRMRFVDFHPFHISDCILGRKRIRILFQ